MHFFQLQHKFYNYSVFPGKIIKIYVEGRCLGGFANKCYEEEGPVHNGGNGPFI